MPTSETPETEPTSAEAMTTDTAPADTASTEAIPIPMQTQSASSELDHPELDEATLLTPTASPVVASPAASTTDSKIDQLIDTMNRFIEMQMVRATTSTQPVQPAQPVKSVRTTRPKSVLATTNGSTASGEADHTPEPDRADKAPIEKPTRTPQTRAGAEETQERINQAIDAIMAYNDAPNRRHDEKWAIGINALKAYVKSQEAIVAAIGGRNRKQEEVTGTRQAEIEQHHAKHQIDPDKHNYKHRGKQSINQVIRLD